jgi:hypothetical protein
MFNTITFKRLLTSDNTDISVTLDDEEYVILSTYSTAAPLLAAIGLITAYLVNTEDFPILEDFDETL